MATVTNGLMLAVSSRVSTTSMRDNDDTLSQTDCRQLATAVDQQSDAEQTFNRMCDQCDENYHQLQCTIMLAGPAHSIKVGLELDEQFNYRLSMPIINLASIDTWMTFPTTHAVFSVVLIAYAVTDLN